MPITESEVKRLQSEFLDCPDADLFRPFVPFAVANTIVKYDAPDLLDKMPSWVEESIWELVNVYKTDGKCVRISNLGEADHTELIRQLSEIMKRREK